MRDYDVNKVAKRVQRVHNAGHGFAARVRSVKGNEYTYRVGPGSQYLRVLVSPCFITIQNNDTGIKCRVNVNKL